MNKQRRKALGEISDKLYDIISDLEYLRDEEQEAHDNLPESIQYGERGDEMDDAISTMEDAISSINEAVDYISDLI